MSKKIEVVSGVGIAYGLTSTFVPNPKVYSENVDPHERRAK